MRLASRHHSPEQVAVVRLRSPCEGGDVRLWNRVQEIHQARRLAGEEQDESLGERVERAAMADGQLVAADAGGANLLHERLHQGEAGLANRLVDEMDAGRHRFTAESTRLRE